MQGISKILSFKHVINIKKHFTFFFEDPPPHLGLQTLHMEVPG